MQRRFSKFAWFVLAYNILVILWGSYVRVSFSGDGCGFNWPTCNGQIVPQQMSVPTAIEFTHRMMTSLDSFLILSLCIWAFLSFPRRHAVRLYALLSLVFLLIEALLGAGLVLFGYVTTDRSAGRAWYLSAHLINTMLLLAAMTVTAWLASKGIEKLKLSGLTRTALLGAFGALFVSVSGAVTALGDTLYPASSFAAGMRDDFSSTSNFLVRLRVFHPLLAFAAAAYLLWLAATVLRPREPRPARSAAVSLAAVTILQLVIGFVNLRLLAPAWIQITHLLIADILWIALVIFALETGKIRS
jgi:heme A synthase